MERPTPQLSRIMKNRSSIAVIIIDPLSFKENNQFLQLLHRLHEEVAIRMAGVEHRQSVCWGVDEIE